MAEQNQKRVELLQAEADENDQSFFRVLVDGQTVKYLTIETGVYSVEDMCFGPALASLLPDLPSGDWNDGVVALGDNGQPQFTRASQTVFPSVENTWHDTYIDYSDIEVGQKLRTGIYEIRHQRFDGPVVAKFARFHWEVQYMENETRAYRWIEGSGLAPRFLGHLTEHGRVIGFLMERIYNAQHASPADLGPCREVLSKLHSLGIRHGDINRFNFLVVAGSRAVLIDFDSARKCEDREAQRMEVEDLPARLRDPSMRGGGGVL